MAHAFPSGVAVIGGGRWARVVAGVLSDIAPEGTSITLCSPSNAAGWDAWVSSRGDRSKFLAVTDDLHAVLNDPTIDFVAIVRAARDNPATAIAALRAGKRVLVEKPFATSTEEAERVREAAPAGMCHTGLVLLFASNLSRFAAAIRPIRDVKTIRLVWRDQRREARYGEEKTYDVTLSALLDVFPHVWSVLRLLYPDWPMAALGASTSDGGRTIRLELELGPARVEVEIARDGVERVRTLEIHGTETANLDFSREPGHASVSGHPVDVASGFSSPLARELDCSACGDFEQLVGSLCDVERAIESIKIATRLLPDVRRDQRGCIVATIEAGAGTLLDATTAEGFAFRELAGSAMTEAGLPAPSPDTLAAVVDWLAGAPDLAVDAAIASDPDFRVIKSRLAERH